MKRLATFINGSRVAEVHGAIVGGVHLVHGNGAKIAETVDLLEALRTARSWVDERDHVPTV